MDYATIEGWAAEAGLSIFGAVPEAPDAKLPPGAKTLLLLGPREPGFWSLFRAGPEYADGRPDPLDRWSERAIGALAARAGGRALFPFGGQPYLPFQHWAVVSGRAWVSPVALLVHDVAGLMVSYRGALALPRVLNCPAPPDASPCARCPDRPCLTSCPVGALSSKGYDVPACHGYLDTAPGQECMGRGCAVRRACPVSQDYGRVAAQSAFHMKAFHP